MAVTPSDWTHTAKLEIDPSKVPGSTNLTNFPALIKDGNLPDAIYAALQSGELYQNKTLFNDGSLGIYCRFESGQLTTDSSANARTLTQNGSPSTITGLFGGGVTVSSGNNFYRNSTTNLDVTTGAVSFGARIKTSDLHASAAGSFIGKMLNSGAFNGYDLSVSNGFIEGYFITNFGASTYDRVQFPFFYNDNQWHTIIVTRPSSGGIIKLYIDGLLVTSATNNNRNVTGSTNFSIGCRNGNATANPFNGSVDDTFVFVGKELTWEEVKALSFGGADLRFTTDLAGTTEVPFEIVSFDKSAKTSEIWVKVPTVDYDDPTPMYVWAGNASASAYAANDTYGSQNVWSDYDAVYHLQSSSADATANARNGTDTSASYSSGNGKIGGGVGFTASGKIVLPTALKLAYPLTVQTFVNISSSGAGTDYFVSSEGGNGYSMQYLHSTSKFAFGLKSGGSNQDTNATNTSAKDIWHLLHWKYTSGSFAGYINGVLEASNSKTGAIDYQATSPTLGDYSLGTLALYGKMDEVRIRQSVLSADWIATEYNNMSDPASFWTSTMVSNTGVLRRRLLNHA